MTKSQTATYERALARATEEGLTVCFITTSNPTNIIGAAINPVYMVNSASTPGAFYAVTQRGQSLCCTCPAAESGTYCKHRAIVTAHLIAMTRIARKDAGTGQHAADTKRANEVIGEIDNLTSTEVEDSDRDADTDAKQAAWQNDTRLWRQ